MQADDQVGEAVSAELAAFLRNGGDGRPVTIVPSVCDGYGGHVFSVIVDDVESGAERMCAGCGGRVFIADSEEFWEMGLWAGPRPQGRRTGELAPA
ncbi:hypothetical protein ACGFSI_41970 [Streptomyces virginiae]|uniref:hypothetical protein n=1 Tax=Streptomyces virginiae TaxID=1961 RepID=UPI0037181573